MFKIHLPVTTWFLQSHEKQTKILNCLQIILLRLAE